MENLIIAVLLYVVLVAIAYSPKSANDPTAKIDYFPETIEPETTKRVIVTQASTVHPYPKTKAKPQLSTLTVRELYQLASVKGLKRYKSMRKADLIAALS